ncbi:hypothetical protein [Hymenobacter cellulosivorans]|uniref:Outer membrane protein beta-barrel domain-containing protein n=1 Tax=Hymenobacter cellulosivorans TaxID=2932249 RepID=A0ABY4F5V9_9BACT|nr:hypothetical protein [Hymenobacter cellulosivorans]UOQ52058.1 hypothetical protein MUN80_20120 [Hymenobacter cellulosivorans]
MLKTLTQLAIAVAATLTASAAQAQVSHFSMNFGVGTLPVKAHYVELLEQPTATQDRGEYVLKDVRARALLVSLGFAFDAPIWKISEDQALGLSLNINGGLIGAPQDIEGFNKSALLDFPEYVTWRYGCKATRDSDKSWGIGLGAGYRYARYAVPFSSPSVMVEGVHTYGKSDIYLRLSSDLVPSRLYSDYSSEGLVESLSIQQQLHVILGMSF